MSISRHRQSERSRQIRIGALISGSGTNLQAIIDACKSGNIPGEVVFVGSDTHEAKGLYRAEKYGIPTFVADYSTIIRTYKQTPEKVILPQDFNFDEIALKYKTPPPTTPLPPEGGERGGSGGRGDFFITRAAAESMLIEKMKLYPFDLLVLAGFMRNLTPYFIDRINTDPDKPRIMNIHPALLPAFPGLDGYGDTYRYGCKVGGCTVHFIDYGEDSGPIIGQRTFYIEENDTLDMVIRKGLQQEWQLYPACIRLFAQGRLEVVKMKYLLKNGRQIQRSVVKIKENPGLPLPQDSE